METKLFDLRTVLTSTTGFLLTKSDRPGDNGIGKLHELLDWMTNDSIFTHQLGRANEQCAPALLEWFPELIDVNKFNDDLSAEFAVIAACEIDRSARIEACICRWVEKFKAVCGAKDFYDVPRLNAGLGKED